MNNNSNVLVHHGIKGQRWGVRRYQNEDGSLTAAGKKREEKTDSKTTAPNNERKKNIAKKIAIGSGIAVGSIATVAAVNAGKKFIGKYLALNIIDYIFGDSDGTRPMSLGKYREYSKYFK